MANYRRKVIYFYRYQNGAAQTTAGFLKLEIRGEKVKITLNIPENYHSELVFYHEAGDYLNATAVCSVKCESRVLTLQTKTDWQSIFDTNRDLYSFDGVIVYYCDNDYYLGDFDDRDRSAYGIRLATKKKDEAAYRNDAADIDALQKASLYKDASYNDTAYKDASYKDASYKDVSYKDIPDKKEEAYYNNDDAEEIPTISFDGFKKEENSFAAMLASYPKLPMYGVSELFDCVRIRPKDIGKLDIGNWKLGVNSFLTHGYYTYQYLMLGNMNFEDGKKHPVIGVPGIYTSREKYLANMFGFDQFIPVKKTGGRNGQFGYWIVEINERSI